MHETVYDLIAERNLLTKYLEVSIEYLRQMWHADMGHLLPRTPGSAPHWTCMCPTCRDPFFSDFVVFSGF